MARRCSCPRAATFTSCGSSSSDERRRNIPKRVRRSSPSTPPGATSTGAPPTCVAAAEPRIDRNFSISKMRPSRPTRRWRKKIGRPTETSTPIATATKSGASRTRVSSAISLSTAYLTRNRHDVGDEGWIESSGNAAEVVDGHVAWDPLEQTRDERHPDAAAVALVDHAQHHLVRRGREREDDVPDAVPFDGVDEIPARAEHWQRRLVVSGDHRFLVEKADRRESDLTMLGEPLGDEPADGSGTDDQRRHRGTVPPRRDDGRDHPAPTGRQIDGREQPEPDTLRRKAGGVRPGENGERDGRHRRDRGRAGDRPQVVEELQPQPVAVQPAGREQRHGDRRKGDHPCRRHALRTDSPSPEPLDHDGEGQDDRVRDRRERQPPPSRDRPRGGRRRASRGRREPRRIRRGFEDRHLRRSQLCYELARTSSGAWQPAAGLRPQRGATRRRRRAAPDPFR